MLQKVEKSVLKLVPKWAKIYYNIALLASDSVIFGLLERCQNIMFFWVPLLRLKKTEKLAQDAAKGRFARHGPAPAIAFLGIWAPGRPRARGQF